MLDPRLIEQVRGHVYFTDAGRTEWEVVDVERGPEGNLRRGRGPRSIYRYFLRIKWYRYDVIPLEVRRYKFVPGDDRVWPTIPILEQQLDVAELRSIFIPDLPGCQPGGRELQKYKFVKSGG